MERIVQDIAGGLAATLPSAADLESDSVGAIVEKYIGANPQWENRDRFKLFAFIRDLTVHGFSGWQEVTSIHGEGSLQAQRIPIYHFYDKEDAKRRVSEIAELEGEY